MTDLESPEMQREQEPPVGPPPAPAVPDSVPPAPPRKSRTGAFFFGALTGCLLLFGGVFLLAMFALAAGKDSTDFSISTEKVAIIPIEGEIIDARDTLDALRKYSRSAAVKAMVVRINSPGGAIAPSQEIYSAIRRTRADSGKPIVASLDSVAASGGFYIASACDEIVSNPGSITGSIGVIMQWFDMKDLVKWAKLKPETITSGALKDAGNPYRELTPAERQYFQSIVSQLHQQFVRDVANGRGKRMKLEEVARIADGRVFTGEQALQLKLVDRLGSIDDAVDTAAKLAHISGEPARIWPRRREGGLLDLLSDSGDAEGLLSRALSRRLPQFLYHW
ncbi:MAG TPA: signal peptide peptidase SppA [Thermoanaerobaculia bacterium]|jgi:protease-4